MSEEMRKEFEEWIIKSNATGRVPNFIMKNENETYIDPQTANLWFAWQASREAMKLAELKSKYSQQYDNESKYLSSDADIYKNALLQHYKDAE
jgi:hypothetical protein